MPRLLSLARRVLACSFIMLSLAAWGFSQSVTVAPQSASPTLTTLVSGSGFSAGAEVDIYFDTDDLALAVTDDTGAFSSIALQVPASAVPGKHWVSAVDRSTGASAQTPFWVNNRWAQFHKRADHDGHNFTENVLSPETVGGISLLWSSSPHGDTIEFSSPAVGNGVVYLHESDGNVYALNASTGALLWKHATGSYMQSSPAVANGVVYFGTGYLDDSVIALNASTGTLLWKYTTGGGVVSSPAVVNGVVYIFSLDLNVYALSASTGALLWKYTFSGAGGTTTSPAVANGVVYFGLGNAFYALRASTGALLWRHTISGGIGSSPAVANGVVYFGTEGPDNSVYALKASTGALLWKYTTGGAVESCPAVANGLVYVGSFSPGNAVYALKASTGALLWKYPTGSAVGSSPAVANGVVYFGSYDQNLYAVNASTGTLLWKYTARDPVLSSPAIANGVIYVGLDLGLAAFGLTGSAAPERPDPQTLSPNLSLPVSGPATLPLTEPDD